MHKILNFKSQRSRFIVRFQATLPEGFKKNRHLFFLWRNLKLWHLGHSSQKRIVLPPPWPKAPTSLFIGPHHLSPLYDNPLSITAGLPWQQPPRCVSFWFFSLCAECAILIRTSCLCIILTLAPTSTPLLFYGGRTVRCRFTLMLHIKARHSLRQPCHASPLSEHLCRRSVCHPV